MCSLDFFPSHIFPTSLLIWVLSLSHYPGHQKSTFTMSKHNRRRTRQGHTAPHHHRQQFNFEMPAIIEYGSKSSPFQYQSRRFSDSSPLRWQHRYLAWKRREERQAEEKQRLKAQQRWIFGGDSQDGDEADDLCPRMLDFFQRLDYLRDVEMDTS